MKLQLREDNTVGIPLVGDDEPSMVVLREPGLRELGELNKLAVETDARWQAMTAEERDALRYSEESPYAIVLVEFIRRLGDHPDVGPERLPAWGGQPQTIGAIVQYFTLPLDGGGISRLLPGK